MYGDTLFVFPTNNVKENLNNTFIGDINNYEDATCHVENIKTIDETKRKCLTLNKYVTLLCPNLKEVCFNVNYHNHNTHDFVIDNKKWELIRYEVGDFFETHKDRNTEKNTKKYDPLESNYDEPNYTYVILIYLLSEYEGGSLEIHNEKIKELSAITSSIETNKFNDHKVVIFPISYYHKSYPVTSGTKYVLKNKISFQNNKKINNNIYYGNSLED